MSKMTEAAKAARNEYARRWRREHPEQVKAINVRYWERRAAGPQKKEENKNE